MTSSLPLQELATLRLAAASALVAMDERLYVLGDDELLLQRYSGQHDLRIGLRHEGAGRRAELVPASQKGALCLTRLDPALISPLRA